MVDFTFRNSRGSDAQTVFALTNKSVIGLARQHYSKDVVDSWMAGRSAETYQDDCDNGAIVIAEADGIPVGFVHAVPGEIVRLFVDAAYAGRGLGSRLMQKGLDMAVPKEGGTVKIDATLNAVPFYQKFEFSEVGRSVFPGRGNDLPVIDVVVMERQFSATA